MNNVLLIVVIIAYVAFIIHNVVEIVLANKFYKRLEKEHQELIDEIIDKVTDDLLGDK